MSTHIGWTYYKVGNIPQCFQSNRDSFRKGNFCHQHAYNQNPDNHWDSRFQCWTTDPDCGLDLAPKRPWLDLVDPSILAKHHRSMDENNRKKITGSFGL